MGCEAGLGDSTEVRHLQAAFYLTLLRLVAKKKKKGILKYNYNIPQKWPPSFVEKKILKFIFLLINCKPQILIPSVIRLLAQLRDMELAFDGFFEKHHLKLHQYLQLVRYEQSFQEVRSPCTCHAHMYKCFMCLFLHARPYFHTGQRITSFNFGHFVRYTVFWLVKSPGSSFNGGCNDHLSLYEPPCFLVSLCI